MHIEAKWKKIIVVFLIFMVYTIVLGRGLTEGARRSLQLSNETDDPNRVLVTVLVTNVNMATQELSVQLEFRLSGNISEDAVTPSDDLTLLINNVRGPQQFDFPRGKRINPIQTVFALNGNVNRYPFDNYEAMLWLLMTRPAPKGQSQASAIPHLSEEALQSNQLIVGTVALQNNLPVPLSLALTASIPGNKFRGSVVRGVGTQRTGIRLNLSRADNLIIVSMLVNIMMISLALSVLFIVLRLIGAESERVDLVPLSLSIALIFGLPALRNVQPGVPPVGALCDYFHLGRTDRRDFRSDSRLGMDTAQFE
jgi:hypothetical protein